MKKQYVSPELKIFSFEFEPVTNPAPTPIVAYGSLAAATSGMDLNALATEIPITDEAIKYAGIQFDHNEYSTDNSY